MDHETLGFIIGGISLVVFWVSFFLKRYLLKKMDKELEEIGNDKLSD